MDLKNSLEWSWLKEFRTHMVRGSVCDQLEASENFFGVKSNCLKQKRTPFTAPDGSEIKGKSMVKVCYAIEPPKKTKNGKAIGQVGSCGKQVAEQGRARDALLSPSQHQEVFGAMDVKTTDIPEGEVHVTTSIHLMVARKHGIKLAIEDIPAETYFYWVTAGSESIQTEMFNKAH